MGAAPQDSQMEEKELPERPRKTSSRPRTPLKPEESQYRPHANGNGPPISDEHNHGRAFSGGNPMELNPRKQSQAVDRERRSIDQQRNATRRPSGAKRVCGKCGGSLTGQFVRALDDTFHLECFTCHECGKIVASKFFPVPDHPPGQYPLCEIDYFKRLDLLCYDCGGALRGSYITALERKYHIEHFTCSICPTVFGAQDSYYEHEGSVYCHYHYSTRFAQKCNGCQTAILKQFVEIFRNGQNQHWHPECYMIHKYWNVRLSASTQSLESRLSVDGDATEVERKRVRAEEERIEAKVLWIWRTLSAYEEKSATCISDMLLHVSNGAYVDGVMSAKRFIIHVDLLFTAADRLDYLMGLQTSKGLSYSREAKLLCKKVVSFFQLLAESQDTGVRRLGVTQELLSLVTGLAHYLKLLIRICLQGALKLERETGIEQGLGKFLDDINSLETKLAAEQIPETSAELSAYIQLSADTCPVCSKPVEDRCFRQGQNVYHTSCMRCEDCQRDLSGESQSAVWDPKHEQMLCIECTSAQAGGDAGFVVISRLQQYVHLLRVAHARLLATLRTSGALPHTSDDPNLEKYDSQSGHRVPSTADSLEPPLLRSNTRSKSYAGKSALDDRPKSTYDQTLGDIRRLRSTRMDKQISNTTKRARTSRIMGSPERSATSPLSKSPDELRGHEFHIITDRDLNGEPVSQLTFGNKEAIRLDDIPRIVAAEQAKEQRPNANRYARGGLVQAEPKARIFSSHRRDGSGGHDAEKLGPEGHRPKKYFSELSALEYFIVRHVAVLSMEPLLEGQFNQEELLDLIEMRKPTFWGKFGKAFIKADRTKGGKKKGAFGVSLDILVERDGAESTDGVGPGVLRVPALVQDAISAMRTMDMSIEGVFRKNGNIRRLKEMADVVNEKGGDALDLNSESPVQVAALLKKFLRELPDPVLTFKLHRLFIGSQKIADEATRRRILHLCCCLLPKSHRDTMEVLFCFLNWASSFSVVDEESGSKMDIHNLATVIAPNILFSNNKTEGMEDSFLAIEAVHCLIECNESMCEVPEDLQSILNDSALFSGSAELTTKEILKRYGEIGKPVPSSSTAADPSNPNQSQYNQDTSTSRDSRGTSPVVTRVSAETPTQPTSAAWQSETSLLRPPGSGAGAGGGAGASSPSSPPPFQSATGFYASPATATTSRDSFGSPPPHNGGSFTSPPAAPVTSTSPNAAAGSPSRYYGGRPMATAAAAALAASREQSPSGGHPSSGRPEGGVGVT